MYFGINDGISRSIDESDRKNTFKAFAKNKASRRNIRKNKRGKRR